MTAAGLVLAACHFKSAQEKSLAHQKEEQTAASQNLLPNYDIPDLERNNVSTSKVITGHEITIIDFWASWCSPCRREMPVMVELYTNYKDKGLGIIGISLDEDYDAWAKAIKDEKASWVQLSELRGWDCSAAKDNSVQAIPHTIVVDRQGRIIAEGLRGHALVEFVENQLSR